MKEYWDLFYTFCKLGAFTFGGGYAMLPLIEKEIVEKHKWATQEEIMDYYAVAQCTPGIIAVNVATFVGYYRKHILGGIVATIGVVFPSIIIILIIASLLQNYSSLAVVQHALGGIRVAVCVLILNAVVKLWKSGIKDRYGIVVFATSLIIASFTSVPTVAIVVAAAFAGFLKMKYTLEAADQ